MLITGRTLQDANYRNKTSSFESASFEGRGWSQELDLQAATLCIQSISAHQQDLAETRRRYHGDMMVSQGQHARLVTEREQSMKLVEIYSLGHPIQRRQLLILLKWRLSVNISSALGNNSNNNYNNYIT